MTAAFARRSPAAVVLALATVYLVWGSTYLAIRVTDRTMPPLLMSSVRFLIAGTALYAFASRGKARPTRREWVAAAIVGAALLLVGNGGVAWAETRLDSGFAALIVAIIPLYVALFDRLFFGRRLSTAAVVGLVVGFAGVALLVRPGGGNNVGVALILVATTSAWSAGSLYARGAPLPSSPLLSASMQMLAAGVFLAIAGLVGGEANDIHASSFSTKPLIAFAYLVLVGSLVAFSAYAWLLKNVRISVVATYAFVNPVVAVILGTLFLNETIGWSTIVAGASIVTAVVLIVTASPRYPEGDEESFNLRQVKLRSGEEYRDEVELEQEPFELGGERYLPVPGTVPAELAITKATTGTLFQLRFTTRLHGPCYRCLGDAVLEVPIDAREYQATNPEGAEELKTPYLVDDNLDLGAWARDAVALELPDKILCRADCAGLCPVCGKNLNEEPHEHTEEATDSRWAALESLREQL